MAKSMCKDRQKNQILGIFGEYFLSIKRLFVLLRGMKRIVSLLMLAFVLMTMCATHVWAEEQLPPKLLKLTEEAYRSYSARETENIHKEQFGDERLKALLKKDLGDARQTSETIHRAVEDFVGEAEPTDDLTKMCIILK